MPWKESEKGLRRAFEDRLTGWDLVSDTRIHVHVKPDAIADVVRFLVDAGQARFIAITAVDRTPLRLELWYHFDFLQEPQVLSLCVVLEPGEERVRTVADRVPAADWNEREIAEGFGVKFEGHPRPQRLMLRTGWSKGAPPMRKR
jgi:Ni,Fe-hydrogenase III component G